MCTMCCVVSYVRGRKGGECESKGKDVRVEKKRLKNLFGIKSEGGLMSSFVVFGGSAVWKFQRHPFSLWCVFFVLP